MVERQPIPETIIYTCEPWQEGIYNIHKHTHAQLIKCFKIINPFYTVILAIELKVSVPSWQRMVMAKQTLLSL